MNSIENFYQGETGYTKQSILCIGSNQGKNTFKLPLTWQIDLQILSNPGSSTKIELLMIMNPPDSRTLSMSFYKDSVFDTTMRMSKKVSLTIISWPSSLVKFLLRHFSSLRTLTAAWSYGRELQSNMHEFVVICNFQNSSTYI